MLKCDRLLRTNGGTYMFMTTSNAGHDFRYVNLATGFYAGPHVTRLIHTSA